MIGYRAAGRSRRPAQSVPHPDRRPRGAGQKCPVRL